MNTHLKYGLLALAALLVASLAVCGGLAIPAAADGTSYYVDCSAGTNGDGSQSSPWNNLASVNATTFAAGDSILFRRGTSCSGSLQPGGSGSAGSPITIGAYDSGARPIVDAGSGNTAALMLYNQEYWDITEIEVTGGNTYGILVDGDGSGPLTHIHVTDVVVHDVWGYANMTNKTTGLVVLGFDWTQQINDILVDGVTAYNTDLWSGIVTTGKNWGRVLETRNQAPIIRNSTVWNTYGDGIIVFSANDAVMEYNVAYDTGNEPTQTIGTPNSIWTWDCDDCVVQYVESYLASSPGADGGAFDIDYYCAGNVVQYSYAHDNDAYCFAVFSTAGTVPDSTVRYNICSNNARDASYEADGNADMYIAVWSDGKVSGLKVHNNTFYWNPAGSHFAITFYDLWKGCCLTGDNYFMNNLIFSDSPNLVKMTDTNITFDYNLYWYTGSGDPIFKWANRTWTGFSAFQTGAGQEANGIYADPLLNDPRYHGNGMPTTSFTLQSGSPAIDAGADLATLGYVTSMGTQDFFGNVIPANDVYDIGAHEYGSVQATATPTPTVGPSPTPSDTPEPTATPTPGGATVMHVEDIFTTDASGVPKDVFTAGEIVYYQVQILDQSGGPVDAATVTCEIQRPSGTWTNVETTGADGWAYFSQRTLKPNPLGTYTIYVIDVTKSGATYDPNQNVKDYHQFTLQ
jgi:hypothetical protein